MKGIILAGGAGTRLYPVSKVVNKHLLPVYNKPMIYYPLHSLLRAGLKDIIVVSDKEYLDQFKKLLTANGEFAMVNLSFAKQKTAGGIADALASCRKLARGDNLAVILGDNIITDDIAAGLYNFEKQGSGAKIFLAEVEDPGKYTVAEITENKIISLEEKPSSPKSNYAVTGLYLYDDLVWEIIENLQPSYRGEMEINDVNNYYLKRDKLTFEILSQKWFDIDTFGSLLQAGNHFNK